MDIIELQILISWQQNNSPILQFFLFSIFNNKSYKIVSDWADEVDEKNNDFKNIDQNKAIKKIHFFLGRITTEKRNSSEPVACI